MVMSEIAMDMDNARAVIGGNGPPEPTVLERAEAAAVAVSAFMDNTPVFTIGAHCVEAKKLMERCRGAAAELEDERDALVRPLNEEVSAVNSKYKTLHNSDARRPGTLDRVLLELKTRLTNYARATEEARARVAELAALEAAKAEAKARAAEAAEVEAKANATAGVLDTDVVGKIEAADRAFAEYELASRFAQIKERDIRFRVSDGVNGDAEGMRLTKYLILDSYTHAIKAIGPHDKIRDAILSAAREYKKTHGVLPDGVSEVSERKY